MLKYPFSKFKKLFFPGILIVLILLFPGSSFALKVFFTATDLPDINPAEDIWQYDYHVSGHSFSEFEGFTIYFDHDLYGSLNPSNSNPGWSSLCLQPAPGYLFDGENDSMALADAPSLENPFSLSFVWFGNESPGSQYFERYNADAKIIDQGFTAASVPLPGTFLRLGAGLLGIVGLKRTHSRRKGA